VALSVPTTQTISDNIIAAIESAIGKSIPLLPKSFTRVLAKALSGVFILVYKHAGWSLLQMFVAHASFRETTVNGRTFVPLIEWGRLVGVGDPVIATNAELNVSFAVNNPDATVLPAGTQLVHPDSGFIYITEVDMALVLAGHVVPVLAASDPDGNGGSGTLGNRSNGDVLKWANPIPQLSILGGTVFNAITTATDAESEADYRRRVIDRMANPPQGGAYADYVIWAREASGILNAYPYTGVTPGFVDVYIEASPVTAADADGTPTELQREAVRLLIEADSSGIATRRPVGAQVVIEPITRQGFTVSINTLVSNDDVATKAAIEQALDDFLRSREPFIVGISQLPRTDRVSYGAVAGLVDDTAAAYGGTVEGVTLSIGASLAPINTYSLDHGQKAKLQTVIYT